MMYMTAKYRIEAFRQKYVNGKPIKKWEIIIKATNLEKLKRLLYLWTIKKN